jgi:hypothetical protein
MVPAALLHPKCRYEVQHTYYKGHIPYKQNRRSRAVVVVITLHVDTNSRGYFHGMKVASKRNVAVLLLLLLPSNLGALARTTPIAVMRTYVYACSTWCLKKGTAELWSLRVLGCGRSARVALRRTRSTLLYERRAMTNGDSRVLLRICAKP